MRSSAACLCMWWREGGKGRSSKGQGRGWKAALVPAEHGGRSGSPAVGRGWLLMAALVLIETSDVTKTGWQGAWMELQWQTSSTQHPIQRALHHRHAQRSALSHSCHFSYCINLFHLALTMPWVGFHVSEIDVRVRIHAFVFSHWAGKGIWPWF